MCSRTRRLFLGFLTVAFAGVLGCVGTLPGVVVPAQFTICSDVPKYCRDHVFVFLLNGYDFADCGGLTGTRDYLHQHGYLNTYYGQLYHAGWFKKEIKRIATEQPDAQFVVLGYGHGAATAHHLVEQLNTDGIQIALLVSLDGDEKTLAEFERPANVGAWLTVRACNELPDCEPSEHARTIAVPNCGHFEVATHPDTLQLLANELAGVAVTIPVVMSERHDRIPVGEQLPTPRPVLSQSLGTTRKAEQPNDNWDFLKPASSLRSTDFNPGSAPTAPAPVESRVGR